MRKDQIKNKCTQGSKGLRLCARQEGSDKDHVHTVKQAFEVMCTQVRILIGSFFVGEGFDHDLITIWCRIVHRQVTRRFG